MDSVLTQDKWTVFEISSIITVQRVFHDLLSLKKKILAPTKQKAVLLCCRRCCWSWCWKRRCCPPVLTKQSMFRFLLLGCSPLSWGSNGYLPPRLRLKSEVGWCKASRNLCNLWSHFFSPSRAAVITRHPLLQPAALCRTLTRSAAWHLQQSRQWKLLCNTTCQRGPSRGLQDSLRTALHRWSEIAARTFLDFLSSATLPITALAEIFQKKPKGILVGKHSWQAVCSPTVWYWDATKRSYILIFRRGRVWRGN